MWEDMILYWAWRGEEPPKTRPPTKKRIEYAEIIGPGRYLNGPQKGEVIHMRLAVTVFDDESPREVNRDKLDWYRNHAGIVMPYAP